MEMLLLLFFVSSAPLTAQSYGWVKVANLGNALQAVEFVDSLHGWTAFGSNAIYRTIDGGSNWTAYSGSPMGIWSISFNDILNGWAVGRQGSRGKIIHTTDGGLTWTEQLAIDDRSYLSTKTRTNNENITAGSTLNFSPDTGKVVTTANGGTTWTETTPFDSASSFTKIQFLDSLNGFIWGYPGLRTRDGGKNWQLLPSDNRIGSLFFIDTLRGWGGYSGYMYHTTDGGMVWQFQAYLEQPDQLTMNAICFVDSLNGWAFGYMPYGGVLSEGIFRTTDGGITWKNESVGLTGDLDVIQDAKMFNIHSGIAVCSGGSVLRYQVITSVAEKLPETPTSFALKQNYPNPFNPTTIIEYELVKRDRVTLTVTDILGRKVKELINNEDQEAGRYRVHFDASFLSSGTYHYTIIAGSTSITKEMVLIK